MYRSILVPLDGTAFGEHALPHALAIARRTGARLHLAHVHVPGALVSADALSLEVVRQEELHVDENQAYVDAVLSRLSRQIGVPVDASVLEGPVALSLADQARAVRVDLVVMSTHARTGIRRLWHRGVAAYLTRRLRCPVLMVHAPPARAELEREPDFQHVLLPLGGAEYSERVLEHALDLGRPFGARYTLLKVIAPPVDAGYTLTGQEGHVNHFQLESRRELALAYLRRVAARLYTRGLDVECDVAAGPDAARAIAEYAERAAVLDGGVDVIAMETHGLGGAAHLFAPGVVEQVVHDGAVPVLVHHAHGPEPVAARVAAAEEEVRGSLRWVGVS
jgi:nucleotide-binding universal stress UspA family protein